MSSGFNELDGLIFERDKERIVQSQKNDAPKRNGKDFNKDSPQFLNVPRVFFQPEKDKTYIIRLLQCFTMEGPNKGLPYAKAYNHWITYKGKKKTVNCPYRLTKDWAKENLISSDQIEPCYICEQIDALYATKDPGNAKLAEGYAAKRSFQYNIIDRDNPVFTAHDKAVKGDDKMDGNPALLGKPKVQILSLSWTAHNDILTLLSAAKWGDISHTLNGRDLSFTKTGEKLDTSYSIFIDSPDKSPLFALSDGSPDIEQIKFALEHMTNFDTAPIARRKTYDETRILFNNEDFPAKEDSAKAWGAAKSSASGKDPLTRFQELTRNGIKMSIPELIASRTIPGLESESQMPPCWTEEPDPFAEGEACLKCPFLSPCTASFQSKTGLQYFNGPALQSSATHQTLSFGGKAPFGGKFSPKPATSYVAPGDDDIPF